MWFYKIQAEWLTKAVNEDEKAVREAIKNRLAVKTAEFNGANRTQCCIVSDIDEHSITFAVIATQDIDPTSLAREYAKFIDVAVDVTHSQEITFANLQNLLNYADRYGYIHDDDEIFERFSLDRLCRRRGFEFGENLIDSSAKRKDLFDSAKRHFMNETFIPELNRIYEGGTLPNVSGHPVHYIIETDNQDTRREVYKILLDALHANHRLNSSRYSFLNFCPGTSYSAMAYESLYKSSEGGTVVVRFTSENDEDDDTVSSEREMIDDICDKAKRYRNQVLTVLCFPRECKRVKAQFYENLGTMSFVELREDFINAKASKSYLKDLAQKNNVRPDKKLYSHIQEDRCYLATEIVQMFNEWYDQKLKNTVYPQYKNIAVAHQETVKAKPRGSAHDELMEMIGLIEAKQVIKKALNYYKMQQLYQERGIKKDNPAMHMIFSGNPGTAKTTVARLFARIMRENGLLSRGQLIEVGRGELVGKYVGWTARIVKEKFKEASGGVLFIDEAYSLVDDRGGSFGDEAINTIVQEMENHRADVVVIFAGYPDKMECFLQKNPGLRSRIAFHVPFSDYNSDELCQIAQMLGKKNGMRFAKDALDKLEKSFDVARTNSDFGNGRYVRNIFEQSKMNQASRLLEKDFESITMEEITTITAEDIVIPEIKKSQKRQIGFCSTL